VKLHSLRGSVATIMPFTQTDLQAIERAIASGEMSVSFNGRTTTYRNMTDLLRARDVIRRAVESDARRQGGLGTGSMAVARFD